MDRPRGDLSGHHHPSARAPHDGALVTSHLNENRDEVARVLQSRCAGASRIGSLASIWRWSVTRPSSRTLSPVPAPRSVSRPKPTPWSRWARRLATRAGAQALGMGDTVGDLTPGRAADMVLMRAPEGSALEATLARVDSPDDALGALITLAREESVAGTWVAGERVHPRM